MEYGQPVYNHVLVRVASEKQETVKFGSLELQLAGVGHGNFHDADASRWAQTLGRVLSVPRAMSSGQPYEHIVPEVEVGDDIVLHFNAITEDAEIEVNGEILYLIPYEYIFAVIRDGKIKMIGGRVLCKAVYEEDTEIDEDGKRIRKTASGIIAQINVSHDLKRATLAHIGTPLKGSPVLPVNVGDEIWYPVDADFPNKINGEDYFCMMQEDLLMYEEK